VGDDNNSQWELVLLSKSRLVCVIILLILLTKSTLLTKSIKSDERVNVHFGVVVMRCLALGVVMIKPLVLW